MEDKTTYKIKAEYDYDDGTLTINIPDIIAELETEDKEALAQLHAFDSAMWEEIKRCLRNSVTSEGFNSILHKLRIELLSGDGADPILKKTVGGILFNLQCAERREKSYNDAYWQLKRWCDSELSHEQRRSLPRMPETEKGKLISNAEVDKAIAEAQRGGA